MRNIVTSIDDGQFLVRFIVLIVLILPANCMESENETFIIVWFVLKYPGSFTGRGNAVFEIVTSKVPQNLYASNCVNQLQEVECFTFLGLNICVY